jgi:DNA-binding NarL/FixJ family response regulator
MTNLKVVLADDHAVVRTGYRRLLELEPGLEVVAEFGDSDSVYAWFADHQADVLVLDLSMPGRGGLETLRRLKMRNAGLKVLVFSMYDTPAMISQALQAGADGYLTKSCAPDALIEGLCEVARGEPYLSDDAAQALGQIRRNTPPHAELSPREFEIFRQLAAGQSVEDIAARLFVSAKTVSNHQTSIRQKLGLASSLDMYRYAATHELLTNCG